MSDRREGYQFCEKHQQEYRQYCSGCALNLKPRKGWEEAMTPPRDQQSETRVIPLTQGKVAIISECDFARVIQYKWHAAENRKRKKWYASGRVNKRTVKLHQFILNFPGTQIDHRDGDGLNNTRGNLRIATSSNNQANTPLRSTNTSGYKGVSWIEREQRWQAKIQARHLGYFLTAEAAAQAYRDAAEEVFGPYARFN